MTGSSHSLEWERKLLRVSGADKPAAKKRGRNERTAQACFHSDCPEAREEFAKASEQLPAIKDRAEGTLVQAPMSGVVKLIATRTIGGVVQPGSTIAEMVPSNDTLLVEAYVRPADIAFVQKASARLSSLPPMTSAVSAVWMATSNTFLQIRCRRRSRTASHTSSPM